MLTLLTIVCTQVLGFFSRPKRPCGSFCDPYDLWCFWHHSSIHTDTHPSLTLLTIAYTHHTHPHPPHAHTPHVHVNSGPLVSFASDQVSYLRWTTRPTTRFTIISTRPTQCMRAIARWNWEVWNTNIRKSPWDDGHWTRWKSYSHFDLETAPSNYPTTAVNPFLSLSLGCVGNWKCVMGEWVI
jgi:hypothetical protein